jgi:hypothetical protein
MKTRMFLAAVLVLAACAREKKAEGPASSEAPAAGMSDTSMMQHDSTMARDTTKKM